VIEAAIWYRDGSDRIVVEEATTNGIRNGFTHNPQPITYVSKTQLCTAAPSITIRLLAVLIGSRER
jgi:hypothetical protein